MTNPTQSNDITLETLQENLWNLPTVTATEIDCILFCR